MRLIYTKQITHSLNTIYNTRVYNLFSGLKITELLLGDTTISSKTDPRNGSKKKKRSYGKVRNNKTILKILSFIQVLYLKQQVQRFCSLQFEKSLFSNLATTFSALYFALR